MKGSNRVFIKIVTATVALALTNTIFTPDDVLAGPCAEPTLVVNKVTDTNDGVCSADDCSLREAVVVSNACIGMQVIQIPAGTYVLTRTGAGEDAADTGDLDITDPVAIQGIGRPVIDGNYSDRVFEILPAARKAKIDGVIIQNGQAESGAGILNHAYLILYNDTIQHNVASTTVPGSFADGGGILSEGNNKLTMYNVAVTGNSADQGGGVMVVANGTTRPTFRFSSSTPGGASVTNNTATDSGGGLWLDNQVHARIDMFEISKNVTTNVGGAGIYNAATLILTHGKILGNTAGIYGGGIYNEPAGDITATDLYVALNLTRMGGGLYNKGTARFYQSAFAYNEANRGQGGAIYNFEPTDTHAVLTLENVTLSGNIGLLGGGGIRNEGGSVDINFSTIAYNDDDGLNSSSGGGITIRNSILAGHPGGNCAGTLPVSGGFNIDDGFTCSFTGPGDLIFTSPLLDALADNGGWSPTHALLPGSPAIDSADPADCILLDEREVARPSGPRCDRGAYEYIP